MNRYRPHSAHRRSPEQRSTVHRATCWECGKQSYPDRATARRAAKGLRRDGRQRGDRLDTYECQPGSGRWHVGHRPVERKVDEVDLNDPRTWRGETE